ncbi:MAG: hypothetical protein EXS37_07255 [Opitutus sp.]|nr:hypothetical protein [Opitutus sp.]
MKFFTPLALLVAALISVVVALPFLPAAKMRPDLFTLEARLTATAAGPLQIFYDNGSGIREDLSGRATLAASTTPVAYRMALPPGTYRAIRLDPPDHGATITLHSLRAIAPSGRVIAELPIAEFKPANQIQSLATRSGGLEIVSTPNSDDPQISLELGATLAIHASWRDYVRGSLPYVLPIFAGLAGFLLLFERAPRLRLTVANRLRSLAMRPARAVALTAAVAVIASAYPIVFLGKSYVSPNLGTILLYDEYPTLPGYKSGELVDVKLSDIGAVMWSHLPLSVVQSRSMGRDHELPLWNRYNSAGTPLLGQGQSMFGDPLHFLVLAANGAAWAWDFKYLLAKWLFATGLGLTVLAVVREKGTGDQRTSGEETRDQRTKGPKDQLAARPESDGFVPSSLRPLVPALLAAAAAPFIGFFLYRINHPAFFSVCYAPWPLYCLVRVAQAAPRRAVALWAAGLVVANLALMNSGTVKEAYMLLACMNFSGACVLLASDAPWRERLGKLAALTWAGVIFVLLTAPVWATFLETLQSAYTGYNAVSAYQIQPTLLLGAFDEIFYRPLMTKDQVFSPSLNFLLLLGVLYFLATLRQHFGNRAGIALAASSLLPLSLAFGLISPLWIVSLPFLGNIAHLDNTFSCALIVLWSVLAGVGFATAEQRLGTREGRNDLIVAGLLLFALVFGWIAFRQAAHRPILGPITTVNQPGQVLAINPFIWDYLSVLLVAATVLALAVHGALAQRRISVARALLIGLCAALLLWRHGLHAKAMGFETFTGRPAERVNLQAKSEAMQFVRAAHAREPARGFGLHGNFFPGWTGVYGLETIHGPDALVNPWLRELMGVSGVERLWDWRLYADASNVANARPFFDALNVRYYFDRRSDQGALGKSLTLLKVADLDVYESPTAWPRAFFTDRIDAYDQPAELVQKIRGANGRPFAAAQRTDLVAPSALASLPGDVATRTVVPATNYTLTENATTFTLRATGPGVVVLTEAHWQGDFRAEINGRKTPIIRLNHAFKGIVVPAAGEYRVTFRCWPKNFTRHLALGAIGALLGVLSLGLALRPARHA